MALQTTAARAQSHSPDVLPGSGLGQHDFLYAGEWDTRKPDSQYLNLVRDGHVERVARISLNRPGGGAQEFDDATMTADGSILFARMSGAGELAPDRSVRWDFSCPPRTECHSVQPIGKHFALLALNGPEPQVLILDRQNGEIVRRVPVATTTENPHSQFRHIRMTPEATILVPLLGEGRVVEIDLAGRELWSVPAASPWSAVRLENGNTLIGGDWSRYVREVGRDGRTVWEFTQKDVPEYTLFNTQTAHRLRNGNTVICSWVGGWNETNRWPETVQALEVTPDKQVVWALRSWGGEDDLGPATHMQLLDQLHAEAAAPADFEP